MPTISLGILGFFFSTSHSMYAHIGKYKLLQMVVFLANAQISESLGKKDAFSNAGCFVFCVLAIRKYSSSVTLVLCIQ